MRFLADMGVSLRIVAWLRDHGHDAVHVRELELQRANDEQILRRAAKDARIVLTMDLDFGYLLAVSGGRTPSVIIFRLTDERSETINNRLRDVLPRCREALEQGAIVSVGDETARVRRLPLRSDPGSRPTTT